MNLTEGIKFNNNLTKGQTATITYSGELYKKDSATIKIVYGFGNDWQHTTEQTMEKSDDGFVAEVKMLDYDSFNFCFRNEVYEWDNNGSANYTSEIVEQVVEAQTPSFVVNEDLLNDILTNLFEKDVSKIENTGVIREFRAEVERTEPVEIQESIGEVVEEISLSEELNSVIESFSENIQQEISEKQTLLDDILSEDDAASIIQEFDMDSLVEEILSPIVEEASVGMPNTDDVEEIVEEASLFDESEEIEVKPAQVIDQTAKEEPAVAETIQEVETGLIPADDKFVVSARALGKFYLFRKRIKLAFVKLFVGLPKLIIESLLGEEQ